MASGQMDIETILQSNSDALALAAEKAACLFLHDVREMQSTVSTFRSALEERSAYVRS